MFLLPLILAVASFADTTTPPAAPDAPVYSASGSAKYEVPVSPELKPYATFETPDYSASIQDGMMKVDYTLPLELTGVENKGSFLGPVLGTQAELSGPHGQMTCDLGTKACQVKYKDLTIDSAKVKDVLTSENLAPDVLAGKLAVAARFGGDLEGVLYFDDLITPAAAPKPKHSKK